MIWNSNSWRTASREISDRQSIRFGIRVVTQHRDKDEQFPDLGKGGNFYLQVNGKDFLVRGAVYTPDLLYRDDPDARRRRSFDMSRIWD